MAKIIRVDGTMQELVDTELETLQKAVGGYIERVAVEDSTVMYVNEDGRAKGLQINFTASMLVGMDILGDVVVMEAKEER